MYNLEVWKHVFQLVYNIIDVFALLRALSWQSGTRFKWVLTIALSFPALSLLHWQAHAYVPYLGTLFNPRVNFPPFQPLEIYVDDEAKLTLHGLVQHYIFLNEDDKNRKLSDLLDDLDYN